MGLPLPRPTAISASAARACITAALQAPAESPAVDVFSKLMADSATSGALLEALGYAQWAALNEALAAVCSSLATDMLADEEMLQAAADGDQAGALGALGAMFDVTPEAKHALSLLELLLPPTTAAAPHDNAAVASAASASAVPSTSAATMGFVLEGVPSDAATLAELAAMGIAPQRALCLGDDSFAEVITAKYTAMVERGDGDKALSAYGAPLSVESLQAALTSYLEDFPPLKEAMLVADVAITTVPIDTPVDVAAAKLEPFAPSALALEEPVDIDALPPYGHGSLGPSGDYCPTSLAHDGRLVKGKVTLTYEPTPTPLPYP